MRPTSAALLFAASITYGLAAGWIVRAIGESEAHLPGRPALPATGGLLTLLVAVMLLVGFAAVLRTLVRTRRITRFIALLPGWVIFSMLLNAEVWGAYLVAPASLLSLIPMYLLIARR